MCVRLSEQGYKARPLKNCLFIQNAKQTHFIMFPFFFQKPDTPQTSGTFVPVANELKRKDKYMNILFSCHVRKVRQAGAEPPGRKRMDSEDLTIAVTAVKHDSSYSPSSTVTKRPLPVLGRGCSG